MSDDGDGSGATEHDRDDLVARVCMADQMDDIDEEEACRDLLEWVAEHGDVPDKTAAIDTIADKTDYNKSTAKEWYDEINTQQSLQNLTVHEIEKIKPYDPDDDVTYEFTVTAMGEDAVFRVDSSDLMSQTMMQTKILEVCDFKASFDDWDEVLNNWLQRANMNERKEEPLEAAHSVAGRVVESIGISEATRDKQTFKENKDAVYLHNDDSEVWARSEMIDEALATTNAEVTKQKLRPILDDIMVGRVEKVSEGGAGYTYAWRFDAGLLEEIGGLNMETLVTSADNNGAEADER